MQSIGNGPPDTTYDETVDRAEPAVGTFDFATAVEQMKAVRAALVHYFRSENRLAARDSEPDEREMQADT